jgi:putative ABC transport system substrate-binding protein
MMDTRLNRSARMLLGLLGCCLLGCATAATRGAGTGAAEGQADSLADPPLRAGAPLVLIAMPPSASFRVVRRSLLNEIQHDFNVATFVVTSTTAADELAGAIHHLAPSCIVLMNNNTVSLYREYQRARPPGTRFPPSVVVMASFIDELRPTLVNATGIAYEVAAVAAFVDLRSVIKTPVRRVGVVYRPGFRQFIARQRELAEKEQIELVTMEVGEAVYADRLRSTLHTLLVERQVDAIWMLNDNELIKSSEYLDQTWRAELRNVQVPVVVGVPNLVSPAAPLGAFAVVPDQGGLGLQTANLVFDLAENGWRADDHPVELPISINTLADVKQLRAYFGLKDDALQHIDRPLE